MAKQLLNEDPNFLCPEPLKFRKMKGILAITQTNSFYKLEKSKLTKGKRKRFLRFYILPSFYFRLNTGMNKLIKLDVTSSQHISIQQKLARKGRGEGWGEIRKAEERHSAGTLRYRLTSSRRRGRFWTLNLEVHTDRDGRSRRPRDGDPPRRGKESALGE